jgi:hypothetical protein
MLAQGQLSNTVGAIYTVPSATTAQIKTLVFFNSGTGTNTVAVYLVPNNTGSIGTADTTDQVLNFDLPSGETFEFSPSFPIEYSAENDTIQASATTASEVNFFVMGVIS